MTSGDVPMIFTNHLGGTEDDKWVMEYDTAGREEESGALARVDASGEDMYVRSLSSKYSNEDVASALLDGYISKARHLRYRMGWNWICS